MFQPSTSFSLQNNEKKMDFVKNLQNTIKQTNDIHIILEILNEENQFETTEKSQLWEALGMLLFEMMTTFEEPVILVIFFNFVF